MIEILNVSKSFGDKTAVSDVNLVAGDGEVVYLLGPNGAGKTTLLRMIAGLTIPSTGAILVNGYDLNNRDDVKRQLGTSLDPFAFNRRHSAQQHLNWQAQAGGIPSNKVPEVLDRVGLTGVKNKRLKDYSYGMLQRVGIASALLGDPKTLVLDEPVNGLDLEAVLWLRELLHTLSQEGRCVVIASHSFSEVEITATRVVVMGRGRVLADSDLDSLLSRGSEPRRLESIYLSLTHAERDFSLGDSVGAPT